VHNSLTIILLKSDAGSDISGYTKRLFTTSNSSNALGGQGGQQQHMLEPHPLGASDQLISLDDDDEPPAPSHSGRKQSNTSSTALMQAVDESVIELVNLDDASSTQPGAQPRTRRLSTGSVESQESSFSTFTLPPSSSAARELLDRLETISSDVESNFGDGYSVGSSPRENESREQWVAVVQKAKERASKSKAKMREMMAAYQELARENEKYRVSGWGWLRNLEFWKTRHKIKTTQIADSAHLHPRQGPSTHIQAQNGQNASRQPA